MDIKTEINNFLELDLSTDQQPKAAAEGAEVRIFGDVYEMSLFNLDTQLQSNKNKPLELLINSPGGSVFDGVAMAALIKRHEATTTSTGLGFVASIASVILLAADRVRLNKDAFLMIHNAWTYTAGEAEDLRKDADLLDKISDQISEVYVAQVAKNKKLIEGDRGKTKKQIKKMMKNETWLTAEEALAFGLIDEISDLNETLNPLTEEEVNGILNKYGQSAPKQFLNSLRMITEETTPAAAATESSNFWDKLKAFFKSNPEKIQEVKAAAEAEQQEEAANEVEAAKKVLTDAGFIVRTPEEVEQESEVLTAQQTATTEAEQKFNVLQKEYDGIMAKLREFEEEINAPSSKADFNNEETEAKKPTAREELLKKYSNNTKESIFFKNLNK